ncbi:exocyst complex component Sec5-domain-containing protein [Hyaloraphidium curvatum]|nr:exocyst complex component Sec5-domain-containing protein [Hyaloraphidium curvatum]
MAAPGEVGGAARVLGFYGLGLDDAEPERWPEDDAGLPPELARGADAPKAEPADADAAPDDGYMDGDALGIVRNLARVPLASDALKLSSKSFDPSFFLRTVHANTSVEDLERGLKFLESTIGERRDLLRAMVKKDFDRFVNAKSSIDDICRQMRLGGDANWEMGLLELNKHLYSVTSKAEEVFHPVIERRTRAEKLRLTVSLLERWKFFFNLPGTLQQAVRKGKIDVAVRDYQKGLHLMKSMGLKDSGRDAAKAVSTLTEDQRRVFGSVWAEVDDIVTHLRDVLMDRLMDYSAPLEEHEKTISYLVNLNPAEDPVGVFLDSRFKWISGRLLEAYNDYLTKVTADLKPSRTYTGSTQAPDVLQYLAFVDAASGGRSVDLNHFVDDSLDSALWNSTVSLVNALSSLVSTWLPDFWRLARDFVDGKFTKMTGHPTGASTRRKKPAADVLRLQRCEEMERQIAVLYVTILSRAFFLHLRTSDIRASRRGGADAGPQELVSASSTAALDAPDQTLPYPPERASHLLNAHPVFFAHVFSGIVTEWDSSLDRLQGAVGNLVSSFLNLVVPRTQEIVLRTTELMSDNFLQEVRTLHTYEDWIVASSNPTASSTAGTGAPSAASARKPPPIARTALLDLFERLCRYFFGAMRTLGSTAVMRRPLAAAAATNSAERRQSMSSVADSPDRHVHERIRTCFIDSLFLFLDGLGRLSTQREGARLGVAWQAARQMPKGPVQGIEVWSSSYVGVQQKHAVDASRLDLRALVIISSLNYLLHRVVPDLLRHLENVIPNKLDDDVKPFYRAAEMLDSILFENYIKRKTTKLSDIVRVGILFSGLDWYLLSRPQEIAAHVFDTIVSLVLIHAEVTSINHYLVDRIVGELLVDIAQTMLDSFRQIDRFSLAGMIQATLETHYIQRSMANYQTDKSRRLLQLVYSSVARGTRYEDGLAAGNVEGSVGLDALARLPREPELQEMLVSVEEYMAEIRDTTANMTRSLSTR